MYYYKEELGVIKKYKVSFSRDELFALRKEIINNCSEIIHRDYESVSGPSNKDPLKIRNLVSFRVGTKEYGSNSMLPDKKLYRYIYDEYNFPYLVHLIDRLIKGDISALDELYSIDLAKELKPYEEKIKRSSSELDKIDNLNIKEKRAKLDELQEYLDLYVINKNQVSVIPYYKKVIESLNIEQVDTINRTEISRINDFFNREDSVLQLIPSKKC